MKTKTCTKCKEEKDLFEFAKSKSNLDGCKELCKKCYNERMMVYYHKNKDKPEFKAQIRKCVEKGKPKRNEHEKKKRKEDACLAVNYNQYRRIMWEINNQKAKRKFNYETLISMKKDDYYKYLLSNGYDRETMWIDHIVPLSLFDLSIDDHQRIGCHYLNTTPLTVAENIKKRNMLQDGWEETVKNICDALGMNADETIIVLKKRYNEYAKQRANRNDKGRNTKYIKLDNTAALQNNETGGTIAT